MHPDLVAWKHKGGHGEWSAVYEVDGREFVNGEDGIKSRELIANFNACFDEEVQELKRAFNGEVVG